MAVIYALVALVFLKCVLLHKVYGSVTSLELKRRARSGDKRAVRLYKVAAYGPAAEMLVWLIGTASAIILFVWAARTSWWLAAIAVVVASWLVIWAPNLSAVGWASRLAALSAPLVAKILSILRPVLDPLARWLIPARRPAHTRLYEKADLLEFLKGQTKQLDNRIAEADLKIAAGAMTFGDKTVSAVMTPRRQVKFVAATENIGPLLMDELHKSGFSRFPVVKEVTKAAKLEVIGTLYLDDLIGYKGGGKVKDLVKKDAQYINEAANLHQALHAFIKSNHHLFIVVNDFEEMTGVVSLEDVLEQIIGQPIVDENDSHADLRAAAADGAEKDRVDRNETGPDPALKPKSPAT